MEGMSHDSTITHHMTIVCSGKVNYGHSVRGAPSEGVSL